MKRRKLSSVDGRTSRRLSLFGLCLILGVAPEIASAQHITIDGTLHTAPAQTLMATNNVYSIGANLGKQVGANLFQSFGLFGLATGESAAFTPAGSNGPISNVIGRVTGRAASSIDGTIRSTIGGANIYLINPSGIVFGPSARVSVPGSFHASTADYIKMSDGSRFQATNPGGSTLGAAAPAAFGFLNATPGKITVNGSALQVGSRQTLGLVGGPTSITGANLSAPAGTIRVTSVGGPGEVRASKGAGSKPTVSSYGPVITNSSSLNVSDPTNLGSGTVFIRAGSLTMNGGEVNGDNFGSGVGGRLVLRADGDITISNGARVHADAFARGDGGSISVKAGSLSISNGGSIEGTAFAAGSGANISVDVAGALTIDSGTSTQPTGIQTQSQAMATGTAGNIRVRAGSLSVVNSGAKLSDTSGSALIASDTSGPARGGSIFVTAGALDLQSFGRIETSTAGAGAGSAGDVTVNSGSATISTTGEINAGTLGRGDAGTVRVSILGNLAILGPAVDQAFGSNEVYTGIGSVANSLSTGGSAGSVFVNAGNLSISGFSGEISSSTFSSGAAGGVTVNVAGPISIAGPRGRLPTGIVAGAFIVGTGNAGDVAVTAGSLSIVNGGEISATSAGPGTGGSVRVMTPGPLLLDGMRNSGTQIAASAIGAQSGPGGSVTVDAGTLTIQGGAQIASTTAGLGKGGDVDVVVAGDITLPGPGPQVTAQSTGRGDAGKITLSAVQLLMSDGGRISTEAQTANGGDITLNVSDFLYLTNSQITASVNRETGNGGNITIDPQLVILNHSKITAQAAEGQGGNINIDAGLYIASTDSVVSASSQSGISGTVVISGPRVDVNGALVVLSTELRSAAEVLRHSCAAQAAQPQSSLVEAGRGGTPQDPDATLPALYIAGRDVSPNPQRPAEPSEGGSLVQTTARLTMHCGADDRHRQPGD
jgi:filamentous hemagglutinin family protein